MWRNTRSGWGRVSIALHWLSALAIVGLFALGWWMTDLGYYDAWYNKAPWLHRSAGMLLLLATLGRLAWRLFQPAPRGEGSRLEAVAAGLGHWLLYLVLLGVLVSGYLISTAKGSGISVFGWFEVPATVYGLANQADTAGTIHWYGALTLLALAAGHGLISLKHHWVDKRLTLVRMLSAKYARRQ
ncbi:cytochrome b [Halomonas piscis]|uniref:Cytochrome b n=1 Tax=Halomonas piscis TaxID=3031727 RepID=A0ABY9YW50_9GAMM|nr:cytochrome b [Halomonas piscis]WNK19094.1 cytochrome b [Halomonas piscis]